MFHYIEPGNHLNHQSHIDSFLITLKKTRTLTHSFQDFHNAAFILSHDSSGGFHGGALLLKNRIGSLHKNVRKSLTSLPSQNNDIWTCTVSLYMESDNLKGDFELLYRTFYQNLYEKLIEFGVNEKINFLCMTLEPGEYLCTESIGFWPYVVEVRPQDSPMVYSTAFYPSQIAILKYLLRHLR